MTTDTLPRPTPLPVIVRGIPEQLRSERRWVLWNYLLRENSRKELKWTKPLYIATSPTRHAKSTDPTTWGTFADALAAYKRGESDGIGFVLGDGWVGYDQDHSDDLHHAMMLNSYTERSPSGQGLHAIVRGTKPDAKCRVGGYELYSSGRYFTVTGHYIDGFPRTVEERTTEVGTLYASLFNGAHRDANKDDAPLSSSLRQQDDDALIIRAKAAKNGAKFTALWTGNWQDRYPSQSEADTALCGMLAFWTNRDASRIDKLFRRSGLIRDKWDSRRGDSTYGAGVIAKALEGDTKGYTGPERLDDTPHPGATAAKRTTEPAEDLDAFLARMESQPELDWLIPGLIPDEGICLWHGQPRDFKSMCAQEVALALAAGRPAFSIARFTTRQDAALVKAERKAAINRVRDTTETKALAIGVRPNAVDIVTGKAEAVFTVVNGVVQAKPNTFSKTRPGELLTLDEWLGDTAREFPFLFLPSVGSGTQPSSNLGPISNVPELRDPTPEQLGQHADAIMAGKLRVVTSS